MKTEAVCASSLDWQQRVGTDADPGEKTGIMSQDHHTSSEPLTEPSGGGL